MQRFEKESGKLSEEFKKARIKNVESYLKLRKMREGNLNDSQKKELKQLLGKQVEIAKLLKQPDLEDHLDRLVNYLRDIIHKEDEIKIITSQESISEEEIEEGLKELNGYGNPGMFKREDVIEMHRRGNEIKIEQYNGSIARLQTAIAEINEYKVNKEKK